MILMADRDRHPVTGRFLAYDCEIDCLEHCAGLCGAWSDPDEEDAELIEALADSLPASPPFDEDPIAIRLGLVPSKAEDSDAE
jgi:hypothetical protein